MAHTLTLRLLGAAGRWRAAHRLLSQQFSESDPALEVEAFGLRFPNPVGLAAGYDKNAIAVRGLGALGFGHLELGTVTPRPQAGNPRPRLHRLPADRAIVNRLGFPNDGLAAVAGRLRQVRGARSAPGPVLGLNLGKGVETPLERAAADYAGLLQAVLAQGLADYVTINVSSPNSPGLRQLQAGGALRGLLTPLVAMRNRAGQLLPILVKIAPDLSDQDLDDTLDALLEAGVDGIVATNTTIDRSALPGAAQLAGGLSGAPLRARSTALVRAVHTRTGGRLPIVGVGGILAPDDALEKLAAGACLVQLYTGLVYRGPGLVRAINRVLLRACAAQGVTSVRQLAWPSPTGV